MNHSMRMPRVKKEVVPESGGKLIGKMFIAAVIIVVLVGTFTFVMQYTGAPGQMPHSTAPLQQPLPK